MDKLEIESLAGNAIEAEDYLLAKRLLEPLLASNSEYALMILAWMHEGDKIMPSDKTLAASLYERAAEIGCLEAYNCLGRVLRGQNKLVEAREVYQAGAELGNLGSISWLGTMMFWGWGGPADTDNAMVWLNTAAEQGHIVAMGQLLIIERQNSNSIFRHAKYFFKYISLVVRAYREYKNDHYSGKVL
jgi:TPR repeat protein